MVTRETSLFNEAFKRFQVRFFPTIAAKSSFHCRSWGLEPSRDPPVDFQRSFRHGDSCEIWEFPVAFAGANGGMQLLGWWKNHCESRGFFPHGFLQAFKSNTHLVKCENQLKTRKVFRFSEDCVNPTLFGPNTNSAVISWSHENYLFRKQSHTN